MPETWRVKESNQNRNDRGESIQISSRKALNKYRSIHVQAIVCLECSKAIIAEYDILTEYVILYEFEPYLSDIRVRHRHPCDTRTRAIILEMVAAEKRLLDDWDPNDHPYVVRTAQESKWIGNADCN